MWHFMVNEKVKVQLKLITLELLKHVTTSREKKITVEPHDNGLMELLNDQVSHKLGCT